MGKQRGRRVGPPDPPPEGEPFYTVEGEGAQDVIARLKTDLRQAMGRYARVARSLHGKGAVVIDLSGTERRFGYFPLSHLPRLLASLVITPELEAELRLQIGAYDPTRQFVAFVADGDAVWVWTFQRAAVLEPPAA